MKFCRARKTCATQVLRLDLTSVILVFRYAWAPLLKNGKLIEEIVNLPIATHLPSGYLSIQPLGLGKGVSYLSFVQLTLSILIS